MRKLPGLLFAAVTLMATSAWAAQPTELAVQQTLAKMDTAVQNRNLEAVSQLLGNNFRAVMVINSGGQKQTVTATKNEYVQMLKEAWANVEEYSYERTNVSIDLPAGKADAVVNSKIRERVKTKTQSATGVSGQIATLETVDDRTVFTGLQATPD